MVKKKITKNKLLKTNDQVRYHLDRKGAFVINDYNHSKPFSNFFPGIAGLDGIPMWAFYVNRGQCVTSFGIESKDKAIMEFQPANKAYRQTALQGFRTFIKVKIGSKETYWEPFQNYLQGTDFKKSQKLSMSAHDMTIEETNETLGLTATVNYFTLPGESYAALVRNLTIKNTKSRPVPIEVIDGLPTIVPYGLSDVLNKNLARTIEAWVKVRNTQNKAPFYQLNVEVSDKPEVIHIKEGNFYFAFDPKQSGDKLLDPIVEQSNVFGSSVDFFTPESFLQKDFAVNASPMTDNKTATAMSYQKTKLKAKGSTQIVSLLGCAHSVEQLNIIVDTATESKFIEEKSAHNEIVIDGIKKYALTVSSSDEFNMYAGHTFLDNILRGGLPISLKTKEGNVAFNVYSRKHGDLERDYNFFVVAPTFYSQGNGNYRDVNQNRRNDVWFNRDVRDSHLVNFLNLSQADGYNPLVVKGTSFSPVNVKDVNTLIKHDVIGAESQIKMEDVVHKGFLPGDLLKFIDQNNIELRENALDFLGKLIEVCQKCELADHGEGYWSDHWTYNLDLIESFLGAYPEKLKSLLLEDKKFSFYHDIHYVLSRDQRYILTKRGVRQYASVTKDESIPAKDNGYVLKTKDGEGGVYQTHLTCKLLCLIANKVASLDPSGIGVEMEADKPNWYDALNGLPGLLGSAISETFEIKRFAQFLQQSFKKLGLSDSDTIEIYGELATFIDGLTNLLALEKDAYGYWNKANDIKERYRQRVRIGLDGNEKNVSVKDLKNFLDCVVKKCDKAQTLAQSKNGFMATYFYHEVTDYQIIDKRQQEEDQPFVKPLKFKMHALPLFLEGYVHALRAEEKPDKIKKLYEQVRKSPLFDKKLKMYKINADLSSESEEIGRTRVFPRGWLENESIWLHMEYKFMLELIRKGLYDEFYENLKSVLIAFQDPKRYGRSTLENSSFLVSSAHQDESLHGQGFVARLSGSTAEFVHIWLLMNVGENPFMLNTKGELTLQFNPILTGDLFTKKATKVNFPDPDGNPLSVELPKNSYGFMFLDSILTVYHNPKRKDTFGNSKTTVKEVHISYPDEKRPRVIKGASIPTQEATDIRDRAVERIDVYLS